MNYSKLYFALLLLFVSAFLPAQSFSQSRTDSLKRMIAANQVDQQNLGIFRELATAFAGAGNYDSALLYYRLGLSKSAGLRNKIWKAKYTLWVGGVYTAMAGYDSALKFLDQGFRDAQEIQNDTLLAQYYQNKGTLYQYQNNNDEAAVNLIKSVEILEKMGDKRPPNLLPTAYQNLSGIFNNSKMPSKALEYDKKTLRVLNDLLPAQFAGVMFNVAVTYNNLGDAKSSKMYLDSARYYNLQYPNPRHELNILGGYGKFFEDEGRYDSALYYYKRAALLCKESGDMYFFAEMAINTAGILFKMKKNQQAKAWLEEASSPAMQYQDYAMLAEIFKGRKEIAVAENNYPDALKFAELQQQYGDSVINDASQKTILSLEAKYQAQKKEKEIASLTLSNTRKELEVTKRNRLILIGGLSALSLLLVVGLLYRNSRQRQTIAEKEQVLQQEQIKFLKEQQQVVSLQSMINGQETERTRIAKDLHDGLGGLFSTVKMHMGALPREIPVLKDNQLFSKSYELVDAASVELRRIAHNMMPEVLMKLGLADGLKDLCNNISAGKLLQVTFQAYGMEQRLNASTEIMLYRIIQELLNNIIKHAGATQAIVQFNRDGQRLHVTVEDNGRGFNTLEADKKGHAGLETVQSRVNYLNGNLSIESQQGMGTTVMMDFLLNDS